MIDSKGMICVITDTYIDVVNSDAYGYIYKAIFPDGSYYFGRKSSTIYSRKHIKNVKQVRSKLKKFDKNNYEFHLMEWVQTKQELDAKLKLYLTDEVYNDPLCMNVQNYNIFTHNVSQEQLEEYKAKLSMVLKERFAKRTPEEWKRISEIRSKDAKIQWEKVKTEGYSSLSRDKEKRRPNRYESVGVQEICDITLPQSIIILASNQNEMIMNHFGYIYRTILPDGRYYVGQHQAINKIDTCYYGSGNEIIQYIKKNTPIGLKVEILHFAMTKKELNELEKQYITPEIIKDPLCMNIVPGGYGGDKVSYLTKEQREHHREATAKSSLDHWRNEEYAKKCTKTKSSSAKKQWSNPEAEVRRITHNSNWYNNGQLQAYIYKDFVPNGWVKGKISRGISENTKPYNNGYFVVYWYECPEGFVPGKLSNERKRELRKIKRGDVKCPVKKSPD